MSFRVKSTTHQYGRIEVVPRNTDELELRLSIFKDDYENACRSLSSYEFGIHHVQELRFVLERVLNRIQLGVEKWDQTGPLAVNASTPNAKLGYDWPLIKL